MLWETFDLAQTITAYNAKHHTAYATNLTWGLTYLAPEQLVLLNGCQTLIEEAEAFYSPYAIDRRNLRADLARAREQTGLAGIRLLRQVLKKAQVQLQAELPIILSYEWEDKIEDAFLQDSVWQKLLANVKEEESKQQVNLIREKWRAHRLFKLHSNQGLLFLLARIKTYQQHYALAREELEAHRENAAHPNLMPEEMVKQYDKFLWRQNNALKVLGKRVIDALLLRLQAITIHENVTTDHVSSGVVKELQRLGAVRASYALPSYTPPLSSDLFNCMQDAIDRLGNAQQKKQLAELPWFKSTSAPVGVAILPSGSQMLVPTRLLKHLPRYCRQPTWWYGDEEKWQLVFKHQQLLASMTLSTRLFATDKAHLAKLSPEQACVKNFMQHLNLTLAACQEAKTRKRRFWQVGLKQFDQLWEQELAICLKQKAQEGGIWLGQLVEVLQQDKAFLESRPDSWRHLWQVVQTASEALQSFLTPQEAYIWHGNLNTLKDLLKQEPIDYLITVLNELAISPEQVTAKKKEYVIRAMGAIHLVDQGLDKAEKLAPQLKEPAEKAVTRLLAYLKKRLHNPLTEVVAFQEVNQYMTLVARLGTDAERAKLKSDWDRCLMRTSVSLFSHPDLAKEIMTMTQAFSDPAYFKDWSGGKAHQQWEPFKAYFIQLREQLQCDYLQAYAERTCERLDEACNKRLEQWAKENKSREQPKVKKLLHFQASLPLFYHDMSTLPTVKEKQRALAALKMSTNQTLPEGKRYFTKSL